MSKLRVWIPILPPGINESYGVVNRGGKAEMYKTQKALDWEADVALIIGSEAAIQNWVDNSKFYEVDIQLCSSNHDVDAPIKLIIDCISSKLGFNDKRILRQCSEKIQSQEKGVLIELKSV